MPHLSSDRAHALAHAVRAHAVTYYEAGGWDVIVECWTIQEISNHLQAWGPVPPQTVGAAVASFEGLVSVWADQQADAASYREG